MARAEAKTAVLADGLRTGDIAEPNHKPIGTSEMGDAIIARV